MKAKAYLLAGRSHLVRRFQRFREDAVRSDAAPHVTAWPKSILNQGKQDQVDSVLRVYPAWIEAKRPPLFQPVSWEKRVALGRNGFSADKRVLERRVVRPKRLRVDRYSDRLVSVRGSSPSPGLTVWPRQRLGSS
jgi:hypothetical protein